MNPYVIIGLIIAWLASAGGAAWFGASYESGQQAKREVLIKDAVNAATASQQEWTDDLALTIAQGFAGITINNTTVQRNIHNEVQTRFVDNPDCRIPLSTLRMLNISRGYRPDGSRSGGAADGMPADGAAGGKSPAP